ncbi:MAG: class A beta-lactamase-related serine hydrolase [Balneolaceae bacterium]|nr:MAG: class A beta-lactamase-related serine hydrolase [Balneolaceae bacterium]
MRIADCGTNFFRRRAYRRSIFYHGKCGVRPRYSLSNIDFNLLLFRTFTTMKPENTLNNLLRDAVEKHGIAGGGLLLFKNGQTGTLLAEGFADREKRLAAGPDSIWHWASVTKTFTSVAILRLASQQRLKADEPLIQYIPELAEVYNPYGPMEAITIRHALSHTSGFRNPTWPWGGSEPWHPFEPTRWEQLVAMMPYTRIHFEPGSRYGYSNPAFIFLGLIIERITGDKFESHISDHIFAPLGMSSAYFDYTPEHLQPLRANSYYTDDKGTLHAHGPEFNTGITVANGGMNASLTDLGKWVRFLSGAEPNPDILDQAGLQEMFKPVISIPESGRTASPDVPEEVTCGLFRFIYGDRVFFGHTGEQKGFRVFVVFDPAEKSGAAFAFNTALSVASGPTTETLRAGIFGEVLKLL